MEQEHSEILSTLSQRNMTNRVTRRMLPSEQIKAWQGAKAK